MVSPFCKLLLEQPQYGQLLLYFEGPARARKGVLHIWDAAKTQLVVSLYSCIVDSASGSVE